MVQADYELFSAWQVHVYILTLTVHDIDIALLLYDRADFYEWTGLYFMLIVLMLIGQRVRQLG